MGVFVDLSQTFKSIEHSSLVQGCWNVSNFEGPLAIHKIPIFDQCFLFILMRKNLVGPIGPWILDGPAYLTRRFFEKKYSTKKFQLQIL